MVNLNVKVIRRFHLTSRSTHCSVVGPGTLLPRYAECLLWSLVKSWLYSLTGWELVGKRLFPVPDGRWLRFRFFFACLVRIHRIPPDINQLLASLLPDGVLIWQVSWVIENSEWIIGAGIQWTMLWMRYDKRRYVSDTRDSLRTEPNWVTWRSIMHWNSYLQRCRATGLESTKTKKATWIKAH